MGMIPGGANTVDEPVMRVPPNNAEAEKSVLGCMMQDREALSLALELLTADDFYQPANREIFDAMHALNTQGMPVDRVWGEEELSRRIGLPGGADAEHAFGGQCARVRADRR